MHACIMEKPARFYLRTEVSKELQEEVVRLAKEDDRSVSSFVLQAVKRHVEWVKLRSQPTTACE